MRHRRNRQHGQDSGRAQRIICRAKRSVGEALLTLLSVESPRPLRPQPHWFAFFLPSICLHRSRTLRHRFFSPNTASTPPSHAADVHGSKDRADVAGSKLVLRHGHAGRPQHHTDGMQRSGPAGGSHDSFEAALHPVTTLAHHSCHTDLFAMIR